MTVIEKGVLQISDLDKAVFHLGTVYQDPRNALDEFVTNAIDEQASQVLIRLNRRGKAGTIEVEDDGGGMTAADERRVATNLCNSVKADLDSTVGEKGIGILAFQEIASECHLISRGPGDPGTYVLSLRKGTRDYEIAEVSSAERRTISGTKVRLLGVDKQLMRQFTLGKLEDHLKKKFRAPLADGTVRITLVEGKQARHVEPESYKGVPFYIDRVRTPYGDVRLSLYIAPAGRVDAMTVYHKGTRVQDLTELDEFQNEPWTSCQVTGEVTNDFNKLITGRTGFVRHRKKWPAWVNALRGIEADLQAEVDRISHEAEEEADRKMHKRVREAFLRALAELPAFGGIVAPVASRVGDPTPGEPEPNERLPGQTGDRPAEKAGDGKPPLNPSQRVTPARAAAGFNLVEVPLHDKPELRSDFNATTVLIRVNTLHPDYLLESATQDRKESYLVRVIAKEMTLYEYPETAPDNLLEKLLDLELTARRHLTIGAAAGLDRL